MENDLNVARDTLDTGLTSKPKRGRACAVIVGSGRSGTSAAANLIATLGVQVERSLVVAGEQNPTGFGEDQNIVQLNKAILKLASIGEAVPPDLGLVDALAGEPVQDLDAYIGRSVAGNAYWGFKDPRTSVLLPVYRKIFNRLRITPKYVLCIRNPAETVASFVANYGSNPKAAQLIWLARNLSVLIDSGLNCYILHYEKLIADPLAQARGLSDFLFEGGDAPQIDEAAVRALIKPSLNRSAVIPVNLTNPLVASLYEVLSQCEGWDFDRVQLRRVVRELAEVQSSFLPWARMGARKAAAIEARRPGEEQQEVAERADDEQLHGWAASVVQENTRLIAELVQLRGLAEDYKRRAVAAEAAHAAAAKTPKQAAQPPSSEAKTAARPPAAGSRPSSDAIPAAKSPAGATLGAAPVPGKLEQREKEFLDRIQQLKARGDGFKAKCVRLERQLAEVLKADRRPPSQATAEEKADRTPPVETDQEGPPARPAN